MATVGHIAVEPEPHSWRRRFTAFGLIVSLGLWGATVWVWHDDTPAWYVFGLTVVLPWVHLIMASFYILVALRFRSGILAVCAVLQAALLLTVVAPGWRPHWPEQNANQESEPLVVMSWNVACLGSPDLPCKGGQADLHSARFQDLVDTLNDEQPTIVSIQEISGKDSDRLETKAGVKCEWTDYKAASRQRKQKTGIAVCVRRGSGWEIRNLGDLVLHSLPQQWMSVRVELEDPDGAKVNVLGIHLKPIGVTEASFRDISAIFTAMKDLKKAAAMQADQVERIQEVVDAFRDPTIMVGDFNSVRNSALHRTLRSGLEDTWESAGEGLGWTREYKGFPLRIDYIYASPVFAPQSARALDFTMPPDKSSDHRAIVAVLHWKQE